MKTAVFEKEVLDARIIDLMKTIVARDEKVLHTGGIDLTKTTFAVNEVC